jgi:hypothetical protein
MVLSRSIVLYVRCCPSLTQHKTKRRLPWNAPLPTVIKQENGLAAVESDLKQGTSKSGATSKSPSAALVASVLGEAPAQLKDDSLLDGAATNAKFASSGWRQYKTLFGRELLSITRNPFDVAGRTLTFAWVGIVMGILYYGLPVRNQGPLYSLSSSA